MNYIFARILLVYVTVKKGMRVNKMAQVNKQALYDLLTNPKFWAALGGILTALGVTWFKHVDPNTLVLVIGGIVGLFIGGSAYENGKKVEAGATALAAQAHAQAAQVTAEAQVRAAQAPLLAPGSMPWDRPYSSLGKE